MFTKSIYFFSSLFLLVGCLFGVIFYLQTHHTLTPQIKEKKQHFTKLTGLPDLALSTDANYIRHRSLNHISNILSEDGTLREYFPSTFVYEK